MATILIVDDFPQAREMYRRVFSRAGHDVVEADSVDRVRALAAGAGPDVVLMDLMLPSAEEGEEALRICRASWPGVAIVAISGMISSSADLLKAASALGVDAVVRKDGDWTRLIDTVGELIPRDGRSE
jgi:CheY-like chemotaxis protein